MRTHFIIFVAAGFLMIAGSTHAQAQRRGQESESSLLRRSSTREELQLTEEQTAKLDELQKASSPGREVMDPFLERMRATDDEAERAKIREELSAAVAKASAGFEDKALEVLNQAQKQELRRIFIRSAGYRALLDPRVQSDLGLNEDQKTKVAELGEARRAASQKLGFGANAEQREEFATEWEGKFLEVLTGPQKTVWEGQETLAAAPVEAAESPAAGAPSISVATPGTAPAVMRSEEAPQGAEVVSSFGAPAADAGQDVIVDEFSFNFQYAPWEPILVDFAAAAGYTLDLTDPPPGTLTHIDDKTYSAREALNILNGYLLRRGYILLLKDGFMVCVNTDKGIDPVLVPDVPLAELDKVGDNELVRTKIQVDGVDVGVMAREVEALVGRIGTMTAFTQTGTFIITDIGANLRRINRFVEDALNTPRADDQIFRAYALRHISVDEAEPLLLTQFGMRQGAANVSAAAEDRNRRSSSASRSPSTTSAQGLQVASDQRTNSLFVTGNKKQHALVEEILKAIDVNEGPFGGPLAAFGNTGPFLRVYQVSGDAREVAKSIEAMMPGVVVNEDGRGGRVHIFATAKQHQTVEEWVRAFGSGGGSGSVAVITLNRMDPLSTASMLQNLFLSEGDDAPTIQTDLYGRRLIIKGEAGQIEQIKTVLADMGEDGSPQRRVNTGTIRRFSLSGRSPDEFLNFLQDSWESSEPNPIRIVIPRQQGPIKELRTPEGPVNSDGSTQGSGPADAGQTSIRPHAARGSEYVVAMASQSENQDDGPATAGRQSQPQSDEPEILIVVQGDELILRCEDEDALTRLEEMMDSLQQSLPYRTTWTVFYLQSADATEAAALLEQFFPNSSVSTTSATAGGFSLANMFRPVTDAVSDMTGLAGLAASPQTLRIIPDTRANSLFVTGPETVVRDVSQMLQVLDSDEIPESMRDMQPRTIEVKYANIDEVGDIIKEIFKPYTEAQGARQQQNNPFAALMGGRGGDDKSQQVRMTVSVDRQTSSLIISSSAALFAQVEGLVADIDAQAQMASPGIRIVQLKNTDVAAVQQSLSSLSPRVTTSSTRGGGSSSSSSSPSTGGGSSGGSNSAAAAQQDAFRRAMEQRMRSGGGTTGRPTFGGGTSGRPSFGGGRTFGGRGGR